MAAGTAWDTVPRTEVAGNIAHCSLLIRFKFNFAGMLAVKLCDGSSCRRPMFSFVREVSQAVPAATSQIHRRHMRTRLNDCLHVDVSYFLYCVPFPRATKEIRDVRMHSGKLMITSSAVRARSVCVQTTQDQSN